MRHSVMSVLGGFLVLAAQVAWAADDAFAWQRFEAEREGVVVLEPSAVRQLSDGRVVIVQDDARDALGVLSLGADGALTGYRSMVRSEPVAGSAAKVATIEDFEGMALGPDAHIYAISSHSRTRSGKRRDVREIFVRARIEGEGLGEFQVYRDLIQDLREAFPVLKKASRSRFPKGSEGFNIEGLCFDAQGETLLIGMRGPVDKGETLIVRLQNPADLFGGAAPEFSPELIRLDMRGQGVRAMGYFPALGVYLIVGQKADIRKNSNRNFHLWSWSGMAGDAPVQLDIPGLDMRNAEGLTQVRHGGRDYVLLVSDDGVRRKKKPAHYLLLDAQVIAAHLPAR